MKVQIIKILVCCRSSAYGEFIALNSYIITEQRYNISNLSFHLRNQKEEQLKPKQAEKNKYVNILPELINKSVKVAGYKNTIVYLYASNRQSKNQV